MSQMRLLSFLVLSLFVVINNGEDYKYMSSLSKYEAIRGDVRNIKPRGLAGCTPINLWIFHRHGSRYPGSTEITAIEALDSVRDELVANHENGEGSLSDGEVERLRNWVFDSSIEAIPNYLVPEGYNETLRTSGRYKERFPGLLDKPYNEDLFYFRHSDTQRTKYTSYAFINGLFGANANEYVAEHVVDQSEDFLLYPMGSCTNYMATLSDSSSSVNFLETDEVLNAARIISDRIGLSDSITASQLVAIFNACAYESAWYQETEWIAPWCAVLGPEGRVVTEYFYDLVFIAYSGYGNEVREKAGCAAPQDLWQRFATAVGELDETDKKESVVGLFSHDAFILLQHTSLGLLKDDPQPSESNFATQAHRLWRTSLVVPFASNIAAVLHRCKGNEYKVLMLRNEHLWEGIPNCDGGICTWENFKSVWKPVADSCDEEEICDS